MYFLKFYVDNECYRIFIGIEINLTIFVYTFYVFVLFIMHVNKILVCFYRLGHYNE